MSNFSTMRYNPQGDFWYTMSDFMDLFDLLDASSALESQFTKE